MAKKAVAAKEKAAAPPPAPEASLKEENDSIPRLSKQQIDLMVNSFTQDFSRIASIQYTHSVGGAKMRWLGVTEGQHELSHKPDKDEAAQDALTKINQPIVPQFLMSGTQGGESSGGLIPTALLSSMFGRMMPDALEKLKVAAEAA